MCVSGEDTINLLELVDRQSTFNEGERITPPVARALQKRVEGRVSLHNCNFVPFTYALHSRPPWRAGCPLKWEVCKIWCAFYVGYKGEIKLPALSHIARKWRSCSSDPVCLIPKSGLFSRAEEEEGKVDLNKVALKYMGRVALKICLLKVNKNGGEVKYAII